MKPTLNSIKRDLDELVQGKSPRYIANVMLDINNNLSTWASFYKLKKKLVSAKDKKE